MSEIGSIFPTIINAFSALSGWEVLATVLGIIYVILAAKESVWCWPVGFFSTLIYTILFWEGQLPMQALLNFYYMGMAVYGFILWKRSNKKVADTGADAGNVESEEHLVISNWSRKKHFIVIPVGLLLSLSIGYYLSSNTETRLPYLDSAVMIFSMVATWLLAHKILQTWLYWLVVDSAAIILYWQTGYYVTIILFMVYLVLSVYGYRRWKATSLLKVQVA